MAHRGAETLCAFFQVGVQKFTLAKSDDEEEHSHVYLIATSFSQALKKLGVEVHTI